MNDGGGAGNRTRIGEGDEGRGPAETQQIPGDPSGASPEASSLIQGSTDVSWNVPWNDLDPGIRSVVRWLYGIGFRTTDSGDGKTKLAAGNEEALPFPHVVVRVEPDELVEQSDLLRDLLAELGIDVGQAGPDGVEGVEIEGSYEPANRIAIIMIRGLDDERLRTALGSGVVR